MAVETGLALSALPCGGELKLAVSCGGILHNMISSGEGVCFQRNHLPQWRLDGGAYFVTWRLRSAGDQLSPDERSVVADAIRHFHRQRYHLSVFVVMDDHVHVVLQTLPGFGLSGILQLWKSFSARRINTARQANGPLWQKDSHTELMRNEAAIESRRAYTYDNPRRKWGIEPHTYQWLECFE